MTALENVLTAMYIQRIAILQSLRKIIGKSDYLVRGYGAD